jgi:outer membrane protein
MNLSKISLIVNAVLVVAVGVLFYLVLSMRCQSCSYAQTSDSTYVAGQGNIVYVNTDSLLKKYDYYYDLKAELEGKSKRAEAELASKSKNYEKEVMDYQDKAQKGLITRSKAQEMEQQLMQEQQSLMKLREELQMNLSEEEQVMNRQLINSLVEYLKEFNKDGKYQYILSHSFGSNLLFVPDSLNITNVVIKGLNEKYNSGKKK